MTHYVRYENTVRKIAPAVCGRYVRPAIDHAVYPSCPDCRQILTLEEADAKTLAAKWNQERQP